MADNSKTRNLKLSDSSLSSINNDLANKDKFCIQTLIGMIALKEGIPPELLTSEILSRKQHNVDEFSALKAFAILYLYMEHR